MHTVSIITVAYNNKPGLEKTIKSVVNQSYQNFEFIIIDGNSNDGSKGLLEEYSDKITYWVSESDKGIYHAMNKGVMKAKGDYVIFLNSGDRFYNDNSLEKGAKHLGKADIIYSNLEFIDEHKTWIQKYSSKLSLLYFLRNSLPHPSTFIRKTAFDLVGTYDEELKIVSDWKWFFLAVVKHNVSYLYIDEIVSSFYLDGISSNKENEKKINFEKDKTLKKEFSFSLEDAEEIVALYYNSRYFEYQFNFLKKYRLVKLLNKLGLIKIPK